MSLKHIANFDSVNIEISKDSTLVYYYATLDPACKIKFTEGSYSYVSTNRVGLTTDLSKAWNDDFGYAFYTSELKNISVTRGIPRYRAATRGIPKYRAARIGSVFSSVYVNKTK